MGLMGIGLAAKEYYDEEREEKREEQRSKTAFEQQKELIDYRAGIVATQKSRAEQRKERRDVEAFIASNGLEDTPANRRLAASAVRSYGLKDANVLLAEGKLDLDPGGITATSADNVVDSLFATESSGRLDAFRVNKDGRAYGGRAQFGPERLADFERATGVSYTPAQVAKLPKEKQREIEEWHFQDYGRRIDEEGLDDYIGVKINGVEVTRSGMVAAAHLGGFNGMKKWLQTGGRSDPSDEEGTSLSKYMRVHGGKKVPGYETPAGFQLSDVESPQQDGMLGFSMSDTDPDQQMAGLGFDAPTGLDMGETEDPVRVAERQPSLKLNTGSDFDVEALAGMPLDELQRRRDLTTDPTEIAVLDRAIQSAEAYSGESEGWRDISTVREGNWRSIAAKADEAGEVDYAERVRVLGKQFDEGGYSLSDQTYAITYRDDNGQTRRVTAPVDENTGRFIDLSTGNAIERRRLVGDAVPSENVSGFLKEYARISGRVEPFQERRGALLDTMRSANSLENLVRQNDDILTSIGGGGARLVNSLRQEYDALNSLVTSGATDQEISSEIDRIAQENTGFLDEVGEQAQLATLFNAEVLRFAFNYAKTGLGQEGVGLSNKDFENALQIVSAGSSYDTFSKNLRSRVSEGIDAVEDNRLELGRDPAVRAVLEMPNAERWTSDLLNSPTEQFVQSRGLGEMYQWSQAESEGTQATDQDTSQVQQPQVGDDQGTSGTLIEQYQKGQPITVTEELAERFPSLQGQVGKTIRRKGAQ